MMTIREISPGEHGFLRAMLYEALYVPDGGDKFPRSVIDESHLSRYVEDFGRRGDNAMVLLANAELVGAVWCRLFSNEDQGYGFVDDRTPELSIAVAEAWRNRGLGTRLLEELFELMRDRGFTAVSLSVDCRSPAVDLYRRSGFDVAQEVGSSFKMIKTL
jgi:ribosomal protein S18 acetylase RimI-like enzyme